MKTTQQIFKAFIYLLCVLSVKTGFTQNVGISSTSGFTPDASAGLDINYTNKGLLMPRVALTATNVAGPITAPAISLLVYNTATAGTSPNNVTPGYYYWNGIAWTSLTTTSSGSGWLTTGNTGTTAGTNFIGTTDAVDFVVKTSGAERARVSTDGNFAFGTNTFDATNPEKFLIDAGTTNSVNGLVAKGKINNYFQMNIKNLSSASGATTDIVVTSDNGTETSNYVDLGINGSGYTGSSIQTGKSNDGYLISAGNDFYLVNSSPNKSLLFLTGGTGVAQERMRILANGRVGMGVQDPTSQFVVKDTMEIRRTGTLSQLLFTNTAGSGDLRIAGDGGDLYWQGGGGRSLQMGSYWTTILGGDRQTTTYPAYVSSLGGTGVLVQSQRDASVPLAVQSFSGTQSANLTEWRTASGTVLNAITKDGNLGIGTNTPTEKLDITGNLKFSGALMPNNNAGTAGYFLQSAGNGAPPVWVSPASSSGWGLTGNTGTTAGTNFLGTTDAQDLVFKANNIERMRIVNGASSTTGTTGDITIGDANSGTLRSAKELVLRQDGDVYGQSTLRLRNRAGQNGAVFETTGGSANLVDFIFNTGAVASPISSNIRFETRSGNMKVAGNTTEWQFGQPDVTNGGPTLVVGASGTGSNSAFLTGNVGIGNNAPTEKLDITGNLKFSGALMPNNNAGTAGYLLQSAGNGASPVWVSPASGSGWGLTGNAGTTAGTNFIGTTDATDFVVKTNNTESARFTSAGSFGIGSTAFNTTNPERLLVDAGTSSSFNVISGKGNLNNYLQLNIQNNNAGSGASSDVVASNNTATESVNYVDMGINSSGNTSTGVIGGASTAYLYGTGNDFAIGNGTSGKNLIFFTGGTGSTERMRINGSGNVGIGTGTTTLAQKLEVNGSIYAYTSLMSKGSVVTDVGAINTGAITPGLQLGGTGSGEGISSKRTSGTNQYGIDFYTASANRMSIANSGNVGIGTNVPASTLEVNGSVGHPILVAPSSGAVTLSASNYTVVIPSTSTATIALPAATSSKNRIYVIVNQYPSAAAVSSYISFTGSAVTDMPGQSSITVQSDGTNWYRIQ